MIASKAVRNDPVYGSQSFLKPKEHERDNTCVLSQTLS
jgi:hypothetical protein